MHGAKPTHALNNAAEGADARIAAPEAGAEKKKKIRAYRDDDFNERIYGVFQSQPANYSQRVRIDRPPEVTNLFAFDGRFEAEIRKK